MGARAAGVAPGLHDALGLLETAHRRIETHLAMLEGVAAHLERHGPDATVRAAAGFVVRFFDTAGRQHQSDEEDDLFPLLRARAAELERPEVSAVMNEVQADHAALDLQWSRIRQWLDAVAKGGAPGAASCDIAGFAWLQRRHMGQEAALILPFAREALDAAEQLGFGERMAQRRETMA